MRDVRALELIRDRLLQNHSENLTSSLGSRLANSGNTLELRVLSLLHHVP